MTQETKQEQFNLIAKEVEDIPEFAVVSGIGSAMMYRVTMPETPDRPYWVLQHKTLKAKEWSNGLHGFVEELVQLNDAIARRLKINKFNQAVWGWDRYMNWLNQADLSDRLFNESVTRFKSHMSTHCN